MESVHVATAAAIHGRCFEKPWDDTVLGALLDMPGAFGWIAVANERQLDFAVPEPLGIILCRTAADECEVLTICVLSKRRRLGVARRLLDAACETAARAGAVAMFLEVAVDNNSAGNLYRDARFAVVGHRRGYYLRPSGVVDALILKRFLS